MQPAGLNTHRTTLFVKNMVCDRCIKVIREEFQKTGVIKVHAITLGRADISYDSQIINVEAIEILLKAQGFALIHDENTKLCEQIKISVLELVYYASNSNSLIRNSDYLSEKLGQPYTSLSKVFSENNPLTLEKYIILIKIEKVKELISYGELTLSEIAYMMEYSSVQYLSNQFKQITGTSVSDYKKPGNQERIGLDHVVDQA